MKNFDSATSLLQIIDNFIIIRTNLKDFRDNVYQRFSSNPTEVINNMISNFTTSLSINNISLNKIKKVPK